MKVKITCRPRYNPWLKKYLNTKTFSKILAFGVLLNSVSINSFAGILSDDGRYETFEGSDITINDILEEDKVDVEIEGNTLVNKLGWVTSKNGNSVTVNDSDKVISFNKQVTEYNSIVTFGNATTEVNKTYTLVFNILKNTLVNTSDNNHSLAKFNIVNYDIGNYHINFGETGLVKVVLTQPSTSTNASPYLEVYGVCEGELEIEKPYLLEGDWTNKEIPSYFEGLQSSFEDKLITQEMVDLGKEKPENLGKYKVEIKSIGKNKISSIEYGNYTIVPSHSYYKSYVWTNDIVLKSNTDYTINLSDLIQTDILDKSSVVLFRKEGDKYVDLGRTKSTTFTVNKEGLYRISFSTKDNKNIRIDNITFKYIADNIQLEEGSSTTEYEPYRESVNKFYLNSPLLEYDNIKYINGKPIHIKNSGVKILDGIRDVWYLGQTSAGWNQSGNSLAFHSYNALTNKKVNGNSITNILKTVNNASIVRDSNIEVFTSALNEINTYSTIRINKSKLLTEDVNGLTKWLQDNPITVIYELAEPIYEPIKADLSVQLFKDTTHISNDSTIPANLKVTVDRTINRAIEAVELAKVNPTMENLSRARMWVNLLKESTKKDELQEEINNNVDIVDLQLERKIASANLDLYIKCENMLSMSLDTNQISFDNFSGVEDLEKQNAIAISVNSSLPYQLNSYLVSEIQNSDKSKTMNKDILNIRENSEGEYKTFNDINEKLVLKDNITQGNGNVHNIDLMFKSGLAFDKDVYKATIKFEAEQK